LLVSGPPEFTSPPGAGESAGVPIGEESLIPIGLVQTASITQQKQIQQLNEIGSRQMFTIPGRVFATANVARILFDGPSLLFAMSSFYTPSGSDLINIPNMEKETGDGPTYPFPIQAPDTSNQGYSTISQSTTSNKQLGSFWGNLGSTIFNKPLGLGFIFLDTESDFYGGLYLEKCFIASYNIGISSQQTILLENVQIRATRVRPIQVGSMS
jgi:hypothetical protein